MSTLIYSVTHGLVGFEFDYAMVLIPMLVGMIQARASWGKFLMLPLMAIATMFVSGIANDLAQPLLRIFGIAYGSGLHVLAGMFLSVIIGYPAGRGLARYRKASSEPEHRRGAVVATAQPAARGLFWRWSPTRNARRDGSITLAGIPVALADETKHFKLIGTTGTGKSTAIRELLSGALARGDRAIIADPDGGYLSRFYDRARGDVILNPFDGDARKWDLFGEIVNDYDIEQLARSLIPDSGDSERIWSEYARTFFTEVTRQAIRVGTRDDRELYRLVKAAPYQELKTMLAGTAAGPFFEEGSEKMCGSLRSVASAALQALQYTTRQEATSFSVRQWVREGAARRADGSGGGVLFLPYTAGQIAALRSVISAWMRLAIFEAMDCGEGDQRLWFVIDELDALGEIDGLKDALARLRKFGGRCILGLQSIGQVARAYGKGAADTIVENCSNTYILRCSASEHGGTSEFASKLIGQREVLHTTLSRTRRALQWLSSTTTSQQLKIEPAVMASEIERLPDLTGFLKLASIADWQRVSLTPRNDPVVFRPRRPVVVSPPPPVPAASAAPPPTDSPVAVVSSPAPLHRGKPTAAQRKAAASKRTRKRPQQTPTSPGDELHRPMATPPPATPTAETEVVPNRAAGAESSPRSP